MSEPDRFDKQAREMFSTPCPHDIEMRAYGCVACIAAALRAAEPSALERAAQECDEHAEYFAAQRIRALIPPAAAPAAETGSDPCQRCGKLGGHPVDFRFDGILMGSWICPHCLAAQEKRIAELEGALRRAHGEGCICVACEKIVAPPKDPPAP